MFDDLRSAWGARKPSGPLTYVDPYNRTEFFVHYDGGDAVNVKDHAGCLARVKQDQAFHMDGRGWSDVGYNGLVCQHGRAIEGRGLDYVGAHCPDHNTSGYGFQFMVGGSQQPTDAAKARMRRLYDDACSHSKRTLAKRGHRDGFATECPGDQIYAWIKAGMPAVQEDDLSAAADDIKSYIEKLLISGYTVGGKAYPGIAAVNIENQSRINAISDALKALAATLPTDAAKKVLDSLNATYEADVVLKPKA
jgi:hypothetical protein